MKFLSFCCGIIFLLISCAELVNGSPTANPQCVCGEANVVNHGRIVNGFESSRHKYPWMAALFSPSGFFMCGGSIISDKTILTAGHCMFYMKNALQSTWMVGMHNAKLRDGEKYQTIDYQLHPRFVNNSFYDDFDMSIAVVDRTIAFNRNIKPICLPHFPESYTGVQAIVAGWGKLDEKKSAPSATSLMETKVQIKSDPECEAMTERLITFNSESMICAFNENTDACQGDSGGPLFIETEPNRNEIVGTVSFGDGCARPFPGIYGKVGTAETIDWITSYTDVSEGSFCSDPPRSRRRTPSDQQADRKYLYPGVYRPYGVIPYYRKQEVELSDELADENLEKKYLYPATYGYGYGVRPYYRNQDNEQDDELADELADEQTEDERKYFYRPYGNLPYYRKQENELADELADEQTQANLEKKFLYSPAYGYGYGVGPYYRKQGQELADELTSRRANKGRKYYGSVSYNRKQGELADELDDENTGETLQKRFFYPPAYGYGVGVVSVYG